MKEKEDQNSIEEPTQFLSEEETKKLLALNCVFYGGINNTKKTLTLVNRCNQCMIATIYWTPWQGSSFTRNYKVPALTAIEIALAAESSSLIAENPC